MKRGILAAAVVALVSLPFQQVFAKTFDDVPERHWAYESVEWGSERGLIEGYPDGLFKPSRIVTEAEFLAMLLRAYGGGIEMTDKVHWADPYYAQSYEQNYPTLGLNNHELRSSPINRMRVAEIIAGTQGVNYEGRNAIRFLLQEGLAQGSNSNEVIVDNYGGDQFLTRAESVQFIQNVWTKGVRDDNGNPILLPRPEEPNDPDDLEDWTDPQPTPPDPNEPPIEEVEGVVIEDGVVVDLDFDRMSPDDMADAVSERLFNDFNFVYEENSRGTIVAGFKDDTKTLDVSYQRFANGMTHVTGNPRNDERVVGAMKIMIQELGVPFTEEIENLIKEGKEGESTQIANVLIGVQGVSTTGVNIVVLEGKLKK